MAPVLFDTTSPGTRAHKTPGGSVSLIDPPDPQASDLADLQAVATGDRTAVGRLYDRYAPCLLALGARMLGEQREAEDVLQDVFVEVWKRASDYDPGRGLVRTWIIMRMRSRCLDRLRARKKTRGESLSDDVDERRRGQATGQGPDSALAAETRVDAGRLRGVLAELPEEQRTVLMLAFYHGLSSSEIAGELKVPIGTVKSRVRAGMARLRAAMTGVAP